MDRRGAPAFFKALFMLRGLDSKNRQGYVLFCAAPENTYLDYLIDFEKVMQSLAFFDPPKPAATTNGLIIYFLIRI
jgi:hypothetical protein